MSLRSRLALLLLALCSFTREARAEFWLKPALGTQSGTTNFELALEQQSGGRDVKVRSLLAWPVNFMLAGLEAGTAFDAGVASDRWLLEARVDTNLGNARGQMEDSDWISSRSDNIPATRFSHTYSDTRSFALLGELTGGYRFARRTSPYLLAVDLLLGNRLEYYAMTALGARGSYLNDQGVQTPLVIPRATEAADYTVVHVLPFIGSRVVLQPLPRLRLSLSARVHYLWSYSHDDHLLRSKDAFGRAYGAAVSAALAPELSVAGPLSLGVSAEVYYLTSFSGVLKQKFYADDPNTPTDERTGSVPDAGFAVSSLRAQGMLFARLTF